MNNLQLYTKIIQNAKNQNRIKSKNFYFELHHIIPKCLGGTNEKKNVVLLTPKEHYICHKLLTRIYPSNSKIMFALQMMIYTHKDLRKLKLSSRDYTCIKELRYKNGLPEETKQKMRDAIRPKISDEGRLNISIGLDKYFNSPQMVEKRNNKLQQREQKIFERNAKREQRLAALQIVQQTKLHN